MMMARRRLFTLTAALAAASKAARAQNGSAPQLVREFSAVLLQIMQSDQRQSFLERFGILAPAVDRTFDLRGILRTCVGDFWASLPLDQRQTLFSVFRAFTIASYVSSFAPCRGSAIYVSPDTRVVGDEVIVSTTVSQSCCEALRIDYVVREEVLGWRTVDVLLDGTISRAAVQRSDFGSYLATGDAEQLIVTLKRKVFTLSEGTIGT